MATFKKKDLIAAHNDIDEVVGIEPPLNEDSKQAIYEKELYEAILQLELTDDEIEEMEESTQEVITFLKGKFGDEEPEDGAEEEEEEEEEPAPKKKAKAKAKAKKKPEPEPEEEEEEEEEEPAPKKPKAKTKAKAKVKKPEPEEEEEEEEEEEAPKKKTKSKEKAGAKKPKSPYAISVDTMCEFPDISLDELKKKVKKKGVDPEETPNPVRTAHVVVRSIVKRLRAAGNMD